MIALGFVGLIALAAHNAHTLRGLADAAWPSVSEPIEIEPVTLKGKVQTMPDYSTSVCHVVELPDPPGGTTQLYTTITTTCGVGGAPSGGRECAAFHLQKIADFYAEATPCPEERR